MSFCAETTGVRLWPVTHAEAGEEGRNTILDGTVSESKGALAAHETTICLILRPLFRLPCSELLRRETSNTTASDVYSMGIIIYETYAREDP